MDGKHLPGFGVLGPHPPTRPRDPKSPTLSHKFRLPPIRKCYLSEQRGIYSDIISTPKFQVKARKLMQIRHLKILTDILLWSNVWVSVMLRPKLSITVYSLVVYRETWDTAEVTGPTHPQVQWSQQNRRWYTALLDGIFMDPGIFTHSHWYYAVIKRAYYAFLKYNILHAVRKIFS